MRSASFTIKVFGVYVILTGLSLTLTPNLLLAVFGIPPTNEFWIRQLGALAIIVGYYYWACGAANATAFFKASIPGRIGFFALGVGLVVLGQAPWQILLFGVVDLLGAGWTAMALKSEQISWAMPRLLKRQPLARKPNHIHADQADWQVATSAAT